MFYENLTHLTCLCHGMHRVCEQIRGNYKSVDQLINQTKKIFLKAPSRKAKLRELFPNLPMPPKPIITRWGTWLSAASYYSTNFEQIKTV